MNLYELTTALTTAFGNDVPVYYHHVIVQEGEDLPVPYIITNEEELAPFRADDCNYYQFTNNTVTLYTDTFDVSLMKQLEKVFDDNGVTYERSSDWDEGQMLFYYTYTVGLVDLDEEEDPPTPDPDPEPEPEPEPEVNENGNEG